MWLGPLSAPSYYHRRLQLDMPAIRTELDGNALDQDAYRVLLTGFGVSVG